MSPAVERMTNRRIRDAAGQFTPLFYSARVVLNNQLNMRNAELRSWNVSPHVTAAWQRIFCLVLLLVPARCAPPLWRCWQLQRGASACRKAARVDEPQPPLKKHNNCYKKHRNNVHNVVAETLEKGKVRRWQLGSLTQAPRPKKISLRTLWWQCLPYSRQDFVDSVRRLAPRRHSETLAKPKRPLINKASPRKRLINVKLPSLHWRLTQHVQAVSSCL
jgi:hypothetical protein